MKKKLLEIAQDIKKSNPESLIDVNNKQLSQIIVGVMESIKTELDRNSDGIVKIPGFGVFLVKTDSDKGEKILFKKL